MTPWHICITAIVLCIWFDFNLPNVQVGHTSAENSKSIIKSKYLLLWQPQKSSPSRATQLQFRGIFFALLLKSSWLSLRNGWNFFWNKKNYPSSFCSGLLSAKICLNQITCFAWTEFFPWNCTSNTSSISWVPFLL